MDELEHVNVEDSFGPPRRGLRIRRRQRAAVHQVLSLPRWESLLEFWERVFRRNFEATRRQIWFWLLKPSKKKHWKIKEPPHGPRRFFWQRGSSANNLRGTVVEQSFASDNVFDQQLGAEIYLPILFALGHSKRPR